MPQEEDISEYLGDCVVCTVVPLGGKGSQQKKQIFLSELLGTFPGVCPGRDLQWPKCRSTDA